MGQKCVRPRRHHRAPIESLEARQLLADVVGLTLINAQTDQPVPSFAFVNGCVIDLATVGRQLNIRADVDPAGTGGPTGSVRFNLDGNPGYKIENLAPYAIGGDDKGGKDYLPWTPTPGTHTLIVSPWSGANGAGAVGKSRMLTFTVRADSTPTPIVPSSVVRINAGGGAFTDSAHHLFAADTGFTGGVKSSSVFPVAGTIDDPLYQSRRYGAKFTFSKAVDNGRYKLTLYFVEPTFTKANQRTFDVSAEGSLIIDDLDLAKTVGAKTALVKTFSVDVSDGKIDLLFQSSIENAIVSGIELTPQAAPPPAGASVGGPVYVDAGGSASITDSAGRVFQGDVGFTGGSTGTGGVADVLTGTDSALFDTFHAGSSFSFTHPAANGHYTLFLEFSDPTSTDVGQRVFDVSAEGSLILNDFDIVAASAAKQTPIAKRFDVTIADGKLDLEFTGVTGSALVSQIELVPTDIPPAILPYSGIEDQPAGPLHDAVLTAWKVRSASNLRQIDQALQFYADDNKGNYPPDLKTAAMWVPLDISTYANPRIPTLIPRGEVSLLDLGAWAQTQTDYLYVGAGLRTSGDAAAVLAYENPDTTPGDVLNVLYLDGHVGELSRADLVQQFGGAAVSPTPLPRPLQTAVDPKIIQSQANLRTIAQSMQTYANEFKGVLPPDFGTLYLTTKPAGSPGVFLNPRGNTPLPPLAADDNVIAAYINSTTDYLYAAAGKKQSKATVLAYENPAAMKDGINIVFADGHVEYREMRWALETLSRAQVPGFVIGI